MWIQKIIWLLLLIELVAAATVLHRRTEIDSNGDKRTKTWTTEEADENFPRPAQDDADFQTFARNGVTLRIKPQTTTLRIGGKNTSPDQLLEQAKYTKDLELVAVRQLLNTGHPVKRTNIENGRKHTSTYTLEPDGSILVRKVEDIDPADVDRKFEEILKQSAPQNPNKLGGDWEWAGDDDESKDDMNEEVVVDEQMPKETKQQPAQASKPQTPNTKVDVAPPPAKQPAKPQAPAKPPNVPTWPSAADVQRDFLSAPPTYGQYPKLPHSWDRDTWLKTDPFNPPDLPSFGGFNSEDFDYTQNAESGAAPQTDTFTSTTTDKDGNIVRTTYTSGPNEWKRKTVKISTNQQPTRETTEESTTVQTRNLPSLEDFLKTQYTSSSSARPSTSTPASWASSTTPKTIKTINIADLPPVAVLNFDRPIEEQFLQPLGPNTAGEKPIKTLKVENISPSPNVPDQHVERTRTHTITKTLPSNQTPSSANLDPNMLSILQRAGIKPEEISSVNGQSITRTRIEPDGRIVKTTYRVSPTYDANNFNLPAQPNFGGQFGQRPLAEAPYAERPFGSRYPYDRPYLFSEPFPSSKHHSASHFGIDFKPFSALPPLDEPTSTFNPKTLVRDREPLGSDDEDDEAETSTLNPALIHPLDGAVPVPTAVTKKVQPFVSQRCKGEIADFLRQLIKSLDDWNGQNSELLKTVVDDDGRVLTAKFFLSAAVSSK